MVVAVLTQQVVMDQDQLAVVAVEAVVLLVAVLVVMADQEL